MAVFQSKRDELGLGKIELVSRENIGPDGFFDRVSNLLKQEWHIVHYAGHSYHDTDENRAYLFFPTSGIDATPVPVPIEIFARELSQPAPFVYLSSCQSAGNGFMATLAECNVPALLGYNSQVINNNAKTFAKVFYHHLFNLTDAQMFVESRVDNRKCLQHAYVRAKESVFSKDTTDMAWAQSVLMLQQAS